MAVGLQIFSFLCYHGTFWRKEGGGRSLQAIQNQQSHNLYYDACWNQHK